MSPPPRLFVGREAELAELTAALEAAAGGQGTLRLLLGEPGIGKTRLADELSLLAAARGVQVAWGRAWEAGGAPPLWPWREALRALGAEAAVAGEGDSEAARFRRHQAVVEALRQAGARAPVLLVLDDLHAADEATLELLALVARALRGLPALLLGTAREVEARKRPRVQALLDRAAREGRRLPVAPLTPAAAAALAQAVAPRPLAAPVLARVLRASEGNPLFLDELARLLSERGGGDGLPLPGGVSAVLEGRLALLPPGARALLEAASAEGREFDLRVLERLGPFERSLELLEGVAAAGLVAPVPGAPARFTFTHILVREALYRGLSAGRRAELHRRLAGALEGASAAELAHHALLGVEGGDAARAVELARAAADTAARAGSFDSAASVLERALAAAGPGAGAPLRADLLAELAEAQARAGLGGRSRETAAASAALARELGDAHRLGRAALAMGFTTTLGAINPVLVRTLREALSALGEAEPALRARLQARLAAALQPASDPAEPIALALQAVALARTTDQATLLATLYPACSALGDLAPPEQRVGLNEECARLAARLGDAVVAQRAQARLVLDRVELGQLAQADAALAEAEQLGRGLGSPGYRWRPLLLGSMRDLMHGRFRDSARRVAEAEALATELDDFDVQVTLVLHRLGACQLAGRFEEMPALVRRFEGLVGSLEFGARFAALMGLAGAAHAGDVEAVRDHALGPLDALVEGAVLHDPQALWAVADGASASASQAVAEALYQAAVRYQDREPTTGMMGMVFLGPFHAALATLAAAAGRPAEALRHFERALGRCEALRLRPLAAHLLEERAVLLDAMGRPREAGADRARAEALGAELGLGVRSRLLSTRRALGLTVGGTAPPALAPEAPAPTGLSLAREGELWAVRHGGRTLRLPHARGLEMLAALLARPGEAVHCTELDLPGVDAERGDAGPVLDARARDAYRARARELEAELREAEAFHDRGRETRARAELEALAEALAQGVGLGGRARRAASRVERSRVNVQRRLKDALRRIGALDPALGRHLERSVRTGTFCSYQP